MLYLILLGVTFLIQLLAASWYTLADLKEMDNTFRYKMLCCTIYVADLLLSTAMSNSFTKPFFIFLLLGILFAYSGDIAESKVKNKSKEIYTVFRVLSLAVFSASSFYALHKLFGLSILKETTSLALAGILVIIALIIILKDPSFRGYKILIPIFCILFLFPALSLGITCQKTELPQMQTLSFILSVGSLFICYSDILHAGKHSTTKKLLRNNIYLFGNMIFVCAVTSI